MLTVDDLRVAYGGYSAVRDVNFHVEQGEFFTLLGPSGCGKTTTLRTIAGLETPTGGVIRIDGDDVFNSGRQIVVPTHRRNISMVFQSYAIWPHMTVFENVSFPLETRGLKRAETRSKVQSALEVVGLGKFADRPATQLSGGQQQRVALARAIVKESKLLLLDEPLSNLDAKLREQMRFELRDLQGRIDTTAIYVTHDQEEALTMSDRIALMRNGEIIELGTPKELYLTPKNVFTARFLGQANLVRCHACERNGDSYRAMTAFGFIISVNPIEEPAQARWMMVRPEHVEIASDGFEGSNCLTGTIRSATFTGRFVEYVVDIAGQEIRAVVLTATLHEVGQEVGVRMPPERVLFLEMDEDE
ncbi:MULTISPECIES: ABC transporter ATP-binding protein [Bradyrhizobium]|uniref:Iron(III) transport system ATP-binding protein n=2 Tax=Bradyrhizobium TaxID=374 RepID=A0ABY0PDX2_9BRAD|nr:MULTISPECIES: ABC transporter ATP-binding protein [Bradyrhizobium]SDI18166.1 iron(III) transport system ATP-binding protein [Bradyrhizobium ottawaense]SED76066.1 iron(III) transport system ATP-binding protein [Bradyrhizobium lablabi]SHL71619.1 iron(III) transport system ATP-binding protein [Bradyrhizobium lablabi]